MGNNYTLYNEWSTSEYASIDTIDDAIDFLKNPNSFKTFKEGLIELLKQKGYNGNLNDTNEMAEYLISKLRAIRSTIENETIHSWFSGKHRPKIEANSRGKMYEICFSLNLTDDETVNFFHHVYYDRAFNCHTIDEAVYYYAFRNKISYLDATALINEIKDAPLKLDRNTEIETNYTLFVYRTLSELKTTEELKDFLINNKSNFNSWNQSALKTLQDLKNTLIGSEDTRTDIEKLKRTFTRKIKSTKERHSLNSTNLNSIDFQKYDKCGLIMKEIFFDAKNLNSSVMDVMEYVMEQIDNKNIFSNNFILRYLLSTSTGSKKVENIPYIVRNNFPNKKVMSDVLSEEKMSSSKSYDAIRKMLVLFDFYRFWVSVKIGIIDISILNECNFYDIYLDEANTLLYQCGYEPLYAGNPYDWIFLCASKSDNPLEFFRSCISDLLPEEELS